MPLSFNVKNTKNKADARYKTIYLSQNVINEIDAMAAEHSTSFNNIVVSMIEHCLEQEKNSPKQ